MDWSLPGSGVHEIFQARILEWVNHSFSRGSSQPKDQTQVSCTTGRFFTDWTTREAQTNYDLQQFVKVYLYEQKSISFSPDLIPPEFWNPQTTIVHSPKPRKLKWGNNINFREITTIAHGRSLCLLLCGHSERSPETPTENQDYLIWLPRRSSLHLTMLWTQHPEIVSTGCSPNSETEIIICFNYYSLLSIVSTEMPLRITWWLRSYKGLI